MASRKNLREAARASLNCHQRMIDFEMVEHHSVGRSFDRVLYPATRTHMEVGTMASTSTNGTGVNDNRSPADVVPLFDFSRFSAMNENMFSEAVRLNARLSTTMQDIGKEWAAFVGTRLGEDHHLFENLHTCRSVPEMQQVCTRFWLDAFAQYGEEAQRLMRISQGLMQEPVREASPSPSVEIKPDLHQAA
jgi:hypothetical protein